MAVRIVEGVPGSGKTYYAVHHLVSNYFRWDDTADAYVKRDEKLRVLSNIESLNIAEPLDDLIRAAGGLGNFFSWKHQKGLADEHRVVYVIDEAQQLFPRSFRNADVFLFFQKHRHLGIDVYLITQDVATLALELRQLAEYYVRAVRRTFSLVGEFRYKFVGSSGDKVGFRTKVLKRDRSVFALYRSMTADETEKIGSAPLRFLVLAVVGCSLFVGIIYYVAAIYWPSKAHATTRPASSAAATSRNASAATSSTPLPVAAPAPVVAPVAAIAIAPQLGRVVGLVVQDDGSGTVHVEVDGAAQRWRIADFIVRCQCDVAHLPPGAVVELHQVAAPGPLATTRATAGSAPGGSPSGPGSTSGVRITAPPVVGGR